MNMRTNLIYTLIVFALFCIGLESNAQSWKVHYSSTLGTQEEFDTWEVINYGYQGWGAPADAYMFKYTSGIQSKINTSLNSGSCTYYTQGEYNAAWDLLASPNITLEAGKKYKVTFEVFTTGKSNGTTTTHTIEMRLGTGKTDKVLAGYYALKSDAGWRIPNSADNMMYPPAVGNNIDGFTVQQTGDYKIAFYNYSGQGDRGSICFRNFKLWVEGEETHVVTINTPQNGTLIVQNGATVINSGDEVLHNTSLLVMATPNQGYTLNQITANGNPIESSVTVTAPTTIDATFVKALYKVEWTNPEGASITVKNQELNVDNGTTVESGTTLTVDVNLEPTYKLIAINVNGSPIVGNQFEINGNTVIAAEVAINNHMIHLPADLLEATINVLNGNYDPIEDAYLVIDQQSFEFTVTPKTAYTQSNYSVFANGVKLTPVDNVYKIESVTQETNITVEGFTLNTYLVKIPNIEGITLNTSIQYDSLLEAYEVVHGGNLTFDITLSDAYNMSIYTVTSNPADKVVKVGEGNFAINNIEENIDVTIQGVEINKYFVKIPTTEGVAIITEAIYNSQQAAYEINYDQDFNFEVSLDDAHNLSAYTVTSTPADKLTTLGGGKFAVKNVKQNVDIQIQGVELNKYQVSIPNVEGVTIAVINETKQAYSVTHGTDFKFSVTLNQGYEDSQYTVSSEPVGMVKPLDNNQFVVENIDGDLEIQINGVKLNTYTVKLPIDVAGATIKAVNGNPNADGYAVEYGADFKFTVVLDQAYNNSEYIVNANGIKLSPIDGTLPNATYQVTDIKQNVEITIEAIVKNQYIITVIQPENGLIAPQTTSVEHGGEISFTITPNANYIVKELLIDDKTVEAATSYTFKNVVATHTITAVLEYFNSVNDVNQVSLKIYPNPIRETINIVGEYEAIELYNISGQLLMTVNGNESKIDASNLQKGTYIIKAYGNKGFTTYKIVK